MLFFIRFYAVVILIGIVIMHLLLGAEFTSKNCHLQLENYKLWRQNAEYYKTYSDIAVTEYCQTILLNNPIPNGTLAASKY